MTYFNLNGTYYGGKSGAGVYQKIINQIPPHHVFISGCLGYCGIMRRKRPAPINFGFDLDAEIIQKWNGIPHPPEHRWYFQEQDILSLLESLSDPNNPIRSHIALFNDQVFIYLDPPYLLESRSDARTRYKYEFLPMDHQRLVATVRTLTCRVAISHYPTPLYDQLLEEGWRHIDFQATTRRGVATERLYMNYPEPQALHDYSYLGGDYKERERIKLKFERWKKNLGQLTPLERAMRAEWIREA